MRARNTEDSFYIMIKSYSTDSLTESVFKIFMNWILQIKIPKYFITGTVTNQSLFPVPNHSPSLDATEDMLHSSIGLLKRKYKLQI